MFRLPSDSEIECNAENHGYPPGDTDCEGAQSCRVPGFQSKMRTFVDNPEAQGEPQRGVSVQTGESNTAEGTQPTATLNSIP